MVGSDNNHVEPNETPAASAAIPFEDSPINPNEFSVPSSFPALAAQQHAGPHLRQHLDHQQGNGDNIGAMADVQLCIPAPEGSSGGGSRRSTATAPVAIGGNIPWGGFELTNDVQTLLDHNKLLLREINSNHSDRGPEALARNELLIGELNDNIDKVVKLYQDMDESFEEYNRASAVAAAAAAAAVATVVAPLHDADDINPLPGSSPGMSISPVPTSAP